MRSIKKPASRERAGATGQTSEVLKTSEVWPVAPARSRLAIVLVCASLVGCRDQAADVKVPVAAPSSPDARVLQLLEHYEPVYKLDAQGRVMRLRLAWRHLPPPVVAEIATLTELQSMELSGTTVDDEGLARLQRLTNLRALSLVNALITDAGLVQLERFPSLQYVWLSKQAVSEEALDRLKKARPDLHVYPL